MPFGANKGKFDLPYDEARAKQFTTIYEKLVEESWSNPELKKRLQTDLTGLLKEHGFDTEGREFETYETELHEKNAIHLPLPKSPLPIISVRAASYSRWVILCKWGTAVGKLPSR